MKIWKAGAYLRLSREDTDLGYYKQESISIENQKSLILEYIGHEIDIDLIDIYVDDGYTGTNFNRPGFKSMMNDINIGRVDCVIVKDLSRLGRNSNKVGELIDEIFPQKKVRLITINDDIDTLGLIDDNDITGFKLLCNEFYVKDISKKVRTALTTSMKKGYFIGSHAPYGYIKDPSDKHHLVIDEEAATVLKDIVNELLSGKSARAIADKLNQQNIPSPINYRNLKKGNPIESKYKWTSGVIYQLLENEALYGNIEQHKRESVSYKLSQRRVIPYDERIIIRNTHEAIFDELTKKAIMDIRKTKTTNKNRTTNKGTIIPKMFSGMLYCSDCGAKLAATTKRNKRCYRCSTYNQSGNSACSSHLIYENELKQIVFSELDMLLKEYERNKIYFKNKLITTITATAVNEKDLANIKLKRSENRISEIDKLIMNAFEDKNNGILNNDTYSFIVRNYQNEKEQLLQICRECDNIIQKLEINEDLVLQWIDVLASFKSQDISTVILKELIDKIIVYPVDSSTRILIKYKIGFTSFQEKEIKIGA